jgi:hypothetical protein
VDTKQRQKQVELLEEARAAFADASAAIADMTPPDFDKWCEENGLNALEARARPWLFQLGVVCSQLVREYKFPRELLPEYIRRICELYIPGPPVETV